jgi:hypothetical protein
MTELALLLGLGALGYVLAGNPAFSDSAKNPRETFIAPASQSLTNDQVNNETSAEGHSNMVPFFGARVTQSMYSGANEGVLDQYTGRGETTFYHKREEKSF